MGGRGGEGCGGGGGAGAGVDVVGAGAGQVEVGTGVGGAGLVVGVLLVFVPFLLFDGGGDLRDGVGQHIERVDVDEDDRDLHRHPFGAGERRGDIEEKTHFEELPATHRRVAARKFQLARAGLGLVRGQAVPALQTGFERRARDGGLLVGLEDAGFGGGALARGGGGVFVDEDVAFESEVEFFDGFVCLVGYVDVGEDAAAANPDLAVQAGGQLEGFAAAEARDGEVVYGC